MLIIIIVVFILLIINPNVCSLAVIESFKLWINNLFPVLYPNFILTDFLLNNNFIDNSSVILFKIFRKIFKIRFQKSVLLLLIGIMFGSPTSTKIIKQALDNNEIDKNEADALIYSSSMLSIPYTFYILNLIKANIILYYSLYITFIIIILRIINKGETNNLKKKSNYIKPLKLLNESLSNSFNIMISILSIVIFFNILLKLLNINDLIYCYFEPLNGHILLSSLNIKKELKQIIAITSLGSLGISIHMQILFIYQNLNYIKFLFFRIFNIIILILGFNLLFLFT